MHENQSAMTSSRLNFRVYELALALVLSLSLFAGAASAQSSDQSGSTSATEAAPADASTGVEPMYGNDFKCTDGYNPDTDPALHPPGQNPKIRMLVNAQAQKEHEDKVKREGEQKSQSDAATDAPKPAATAALDSTQKDDKDATKKKTDDEQKKKDESKADDKKKADDNNQSDKDTAKKDEKKSQPVAQGPYNPLKEAVFAIQCRNYQESAGVLAKVLTKNPNDAQAHYLLGVSYVGLKNFDQAESEYNKVLKLVPTSKLAEMASEGLKKLGK